jgi:hypothetical protein
MTYTAVDIEVDINANQVKNFGPPGDFDAIVAVTESEYETRCQYIFKLITPKTINAGSDLATESTVDQILVSRTMELLWELLFPDQVEFTLAAIDHGKVQDLWLPNGLLRPIVGMINTFVFTPTRNILLIRVRIHGIDTKQNHVGTYFTVRIENDSTEYNSISKPSPYSGGKGKLTPVVNTIYQHLGNVTVLVRNLVTKQTSMLSLVTKLFMAYAPEDYTESVAEGTPFDQFMADSIFTGRLTSEVLSNILNVHVQIATFISETSYTFNKTEGDREFVAFVNRIGENPDPDGQSETAFSNVCAELVKLKTAYDKTEAYLETNFSIWKYYSNFTHIATPATAIDTEKRQLGRPINLSTFFALDTAVIALTFAESTSTTSNTPSNQAAFDIAKAALIAAQTAHTAYIDAEFLSYAMTH